MMSEERELLAQIMRYFAAGDIAVKEFEMSSDIEETLHNAQELLAQPEPEPLSPIEKHEIFLMSLIENNGEGLKELKAFDLEIYNKLKEVFGNES